MQATSFRRNLFVLLLGLHGLFALFWISRLSTAIDDQRYYTLFDDAMVSMRYAKNLADGNGLVWNAGGEKVEGFSNPLWTFAMAGAHLLGLPARHVSLVIQLLSVGLMTGTLVFVRKIVLLFDREESYTPHIAVVLTAFYLPLQYWGIHGMEVHAQTFLLAVGTYLILKGTFRDSDRHFFHIVLFIVPWVRLDFVVPFLALLGGAWLIDRRSNTRSVLVGIAVLCGSVAVQTGARWLYYGDIVPNTFHLKLSDIPLLLRFSEGSAAVISFLAGVGPLLVALALASPWLKRARPLHLLLLILAAQLAYTIYIGGDSWERFGGSNRFISVQMPLFFCLVALAGVHVFRLVLSSRSTGIGLGSVATAVLVVVTGLWMMHRETLWQDGDYLMLRTQPYHIVEHRNHVRKAVALEKGITKEAKVAVVWAGIVPYFIDNECIDILGKNDPRIARLAGTPPSAASPGPYEPGHVKVDYAYSIGELRPDVIVELWNRKEEAFAAMGEDYMRGTIGGQAFYFRKGSPEVRWDNVHDVEPIVPDE